MQPEVTEGLRAAAVARLDAPIADVISSQGVLADSHTMHTMISGIQQELHGFGVLSPLLDRTDITDVLVNGADEVWIDDGSLQRTSIVFESEASVRRLATRLASMAGRRLDDASPWVDARLPNGIRLHAMLSPLSRSGTTISLRIPSSTPFTLADLQRRRMFTAPMMKSLRTSIQRGDALLISGGTGTGKTTLLAALLAEVPARERIVVAEDSAELRVSHPHVVYLEGRPANVEGAGAVTLRELVRQSLRMRPDRLIVGEVRGDEVKDLLNALNTGHAGGAATVHANSAADALVRLELLALQAGLSMAAAQRAIRSAFDVVVHIERDPAGRRSVHEIVTMDTLQPSTQVA